MSGLVTTAAPRARVIRVNDWLIAMRFPIYLQVRPNLRPANITIVSEPMTGNLATSRATIAAVGAAPTATATPAATAAGRPALSLLVVASTNNIARGLSFPFPVGVPLTVARAVPPPVLL